MPKQVVILCNGKFPTKEYPKYLLRTADFIICCDGALKRFMRNCTNVFGKERLPDLVIGDMDSISKELKSKYSDIIVQVDEQEHNDQTKAFRWALENLEDIAAIHILGATGYREDHTIGNMSLLMEYARTYNLEQMGIKADMITDYGTIFAATDTFEIECGEGRRVSIFSPDNELKIKSYGLVWKTDDVVFDNWWKATLNRSCEDKIKLEFSKKSIALIMLD